MTARALGSSLAVTAPPCPALSTTRAIARKCRAAPRPWRRLLEAFDPANEPGRLTYEDPDARRTKALADPRLEREPAIEIDPELQAKFSLQSGETAAIAFALKYSGSLLLTDDAAARRACVSVGLAAVGTIGLVLEAARSKRVSVDEALRALEQLPNKGRLHVAPERLSA